MKLLVHTTTKRMARGGMSKKCVVLDVTFESKRRKKISDKAVTHKSEVKKPTTPMMINGRMSTMEVIGRAD